MAKARYLVRLYSSHDLDLVTFTLTHDFDIIRAMYSSLKAFAKGEQFIIKIPPAVRALPGLKRVYAKVLFLDPEKDKDAVELLEAIVPGKRNNFLKNLLRLYLAYPFSECFFESADDLELFERKLSVFRQGRREVMAGKTRRSQRKERELSSQIADKPDGGEKRTDRPGSSEEYIQEHEKLTKTEAADIAGAEDADAILALFEGL